MPKNKEYNIAIINSSSFGRIFPQHLEELEKIGKVERFDIASDISGKDLAEKLKDFNIVISSVTPFFTKEFFDHKKDLILISRHGIGYNNIDCKAAKEAGCLVSIVSALVERDAVAENNVTNLLALMRRTTQSFEAVKNDEWAARAKFTGNSLLHKTAGIIGIGNTGSLVAQILRNGFLDNVIAYDPNKDQLYMDSFGVKKVDLDELLEKSDVICLCASLNDESYHMIGADQVAKMKNGVYISNSARGALVDEQAICDGLLSKKIAGYATDVLEAEPGSNTHPFLAFDNVIITPHTSAYTLECLENMGKKCVQDVKDVVSGKIPERAVQPESKYLK